MRLALPLLAALWLAACATPRVESPASTAARPVAVSAGTVTVPERYVTPENPEDELDSLATWPTEDGAIWLIATAKNTHELVVFDADSGEQLRSVGRRGPGDGEFLRPNGVFVHGDLLFVSERDNRRVQMLALPGFDPLGTFGQDVLRSPYGLWAHEPAPGTLELYVTDSFMDGDRFDVVPPLQTLDRRLRRFQVRVDVAGRPHVDAGIAFGDTRPALALHVVESLVGDPVHDRLLVADEHRERRALREYTLAGRATTGGIAPGVFQGEPEGLALWACTPDTGYWIAADQLLPLTVFRVFDRATLAPRGTFSGQVTAWTDGVALHASPTPRFPAGALFAVHHDRSVAAFDLGDIVQALGLDPACAR
ncbi:phytase [Luteimonas kalidii]|uniref:Phytase n=1 Tax=Luteimonas kalidii TaxID=3042025 RepID=A0ABT6JW19_9GAMM|nr:phytase [Luteimonas kalidii]MDH5834675.1 phytase [Luteimonas kalidii]